MKRTFTFATSALFAWLFIVVIPHHHHQTSFQTNPALDHTENANVTYHSNQCQICLISAEKLLKPYNATFEYLPELVGVAGEVALEYLPPYYFKDNADRAPPSLI